MRDGLLVNALRVVDGRLPEAVLKFGLTLAMASGAWGTELYLSTNELQLTDRVRMLGLVFTVQASLSSYAAISLQTSLRVQFVSNPALVFRIKGAFKVRGSAELTGEMLGTWVRPFGVRGLSIADVGVGVEFGTVSSFSLAFSLTIHSVTVELATKLPFPDLRDLYLSGSVTKGNDGHVRPLSLKVRAFAWKPNSLRF